MNRQNHQQLQPAYVLHQRPYRDTSAIVDLFTLEQGRISVVVRGIRKPKSKWMGIVRAFQPLLVNWIGKGDLGTLIKAETQGQPQLIAAKYIMSGLYMNELIIRLLYSRDQNVELFSCYSHSIKKISDLSAQPPVAHTPTREQKLQLELILRKFEVQLLQSLGYGLILDHDATSGEVIRENKMYIYSFGHGPEHRSATACPTEDNKNAHGLAISGRTLLALGSGRLSCVPNTVETLREAKRLMRYLLSGYLGSKNLNSREIYSTYGR